MTFSSTNVRKFESVLETKVLRNSSFAQIVIAGDNCLYTFLKDPLISLILIDFDIELAQKSS